MTDLRIRRLRKRYRLPVSAREERRRLDRVLAAAMEEPLLDAALDRAGVPRTEEICLRNVSSVVRLRQSDSDARLAVAWSVALAEAIASSLHDGGPDVARYRSRPEALAEMVRDASGGDLRRAWAWRQLGLWTEGDALPPATARRAALDVLADNPRGAAAVLRVIAAEGGLPRLLADVPAAAWIRLARTALDAAGASGRTIRALDEAEPSPRAPAPLPGADRVTHRSAIANAVRRSSARLPRETALALGALALLEREPERVATTDAADLVRAIGTALSPPPGARGPEPPMPAAPASGTIREPASAAAQSASHTAPHNEPTLPKPAGEDIRPRGRTTRGGLLFLLHLVRALDIPGAVRGELSLAARPLRWTLHQMALALAPVGAGDPAALAFAGLPPASRPPSEEERPATAEELAVIQGFCDSVTSTLRTRLRASEREEDATLLDRVLVRPAEIVSDPGWIEACFALADATTDVRRASLDLDLGWIPWLGVVVRFAYV